ncbi:MAG: phosphatase, partial [Gordonia amarae]
MRIPLQLFTADTRIGQSSRARVTCRYKCGEACWHEPGNTSDNAYFRDIARTAISRRSALTAAGATVLGVT